MVQIEYPVINMVATGKRIRELRKERGITVRELSDYMGFSEPQAVYKWQRGDSLPTVDNLLALSRILGTTMEDILIGDDGMSSVFYGKAWNRIEKVNQRFIFLCGEVSIIRNVLQ